MYQLKYILLYIQTEVEDLYSKTLCRVKSDILGEFYAFTQVSFLLINKQTFQDVNKKNIYYILKEANANCRTIS